jgi:hypothetical protein
MLVLLPMSVKPFGRLSQNLVSLPRSVATPAPPDYHLEDDLSPLCLADETKVFLRSPWHGTLDCSTGSN